MVISFKEHPVLTSGLFVFIFEMTYTFVHTLLTYTFKSAIVSPIILSPNTSRKILAMGTFSTKAAGYFFVHYFFSSALELTEFVMAIDAL